MNRRVAFQAAMPPFLGACFPNASASLPPRCSLRLSLRSLHCYLQVFCYFSQVSCRLRQLRYSGALRSGYGRNRDASVIGEQVAMRMGNFLDQPVSTQHPQLPAHGGAAPFAFGGIGRLTAVEQALQVSIAESVQVEFPPTDRQQQLVVPVSYTHLRAHETRHDLVCRLLL